LRFLKWGRGKNRDQKYEFIIDVLGPLHSYYRYEKSEMEHAHTLPNNKTINVRKANLYRLDPDFKTRIRYKIRGIDSGFLVVFKSDDDDPIEYISPKYSAKVLKTINESQALKTALKDEFARAMDAKTVFMYFLLIAGALVVYLFITGQVTL